MRPDAFAAVMATGIVSYAARDNGYPIVSMPLAVIAVVLLPALMIATARTWRRERWSVTDLDVAFGLCTYVAACCVLASRFSEHQIVLWILVPMAVQGWLSLAPAVAAGLWRQRGTALRDRARGGWELAGVATSGLAIVFVAAHSLFWAVIAWVLALVVYLLITALVLWRWLHARSVHSAPDSWILMGALAISTLAGVHLHAALAPGSFADAVLAMTVATCATATLWIPVLLIMGVRRVDAWPAVFPLGMYSAATHAVAQETGRHALATVSLVFCWVAVAAWLVTAARSVQRLRR